MNVETNDSSGSNRTAADNTAAELLAAMASDSLLGECSSDNTPSNSTKRTQSSSSSSSSQRSAVNDVDSADEREGNDSNQQVNAAESDDGTQLPQPRPLPEFSSRLLVMCSLTKYFPLFFVILLRSIIIFNGWEFSSLIIMMGPGAKILEIKWGKVLKMAE